MRCMRHIECYNLSVSHMRTLSPIRSVSPGPKPKIVFNYQPSPLRERPPTSNITPNAKQYQPTMLISPNIRTNNFVNDFQRDIIISQGRCLACPKQATYKVVNDGRNYCSVCAIQIMKKGCEVVRIELKDQKFYKDFHQRTDKENQMTMFSPKVKQFTESRTQPNKHRETQLNELLTNIDHEKEELHQLLNKLNSQQLTSQGIKAIYHQKKLSLKRHYQKIKAAIKQSIQKDLEELDRKEKSSIKCIEEKKQELKDNIFLLQQIKQDVEPNRNEIVTVIQETDYLKMLKQHKEDTKNILENKEISMYIISQLTSHELNSNLSESQLVRKTQQHLASSRVGDLYDPYTYTLIDSKQKKGETLFSFEGKIK